MKVFTAAVASVLAVCLFAACFAHAADSSDVLTLTPDNFDTYVGGEHGAFVEFFAPWCGHCKSLAPVYADLAKSFKNEDVVVAAVDADAHRELGSRFGVTGFPTLKWFPAGSAEPEAYSGGRTIEDLTKFINDQAGTSVEVYTPPTNVLALNDNTFDETVLDSDKDVLVEFYAPWCGHCKRLAPEYEKLGDAFATEKDVVIAKVNADSHKIKSSKYGVTGFPTLLWFPKGEKDGEKYTSGRTAEDLVKFINQRTGTERTVGGGFTDAAGIIPGFSSLVAKFNEADDKEAVLKEAQEFANSDEIKNHRNAAFAKYYTVSMKRIIAKGEDYAKTEAQRLGRLISSGSVKAEKVAQFSKRKNIIKLFQ